MSKTFNRLTDKLSKESGCDWDFLVKMYNYILDKHGDVDWDRFENCVMKHDWGVRGDGRFENILVRLCEESGYTYGRLFMLYTDMVYDQDDDGDFEYFRSVTLEKDW